MVLGILSCKIDRIKFCLHMSIKLQCSDVWSRLEQVTCESLIYITLCNLLYLHFAFITFYINIVIVSSNSSTNNFTFLPYLNKCNTFIAICIYLSTIANPPEIWFVVRTFSSVPTVTVAAYSTVIYSKLQ